MEREWEGGKERVREMSYRDEGGGGGMKWPK